MEFIAVIDRIHLSNTLFLTNLAQGLRTHQTDRTILLHGDSEYTEQLIQTGMMREDAQLRSTRDLNRRLVALFADNQVSCIGMNGYQRDCVQYDGVQLEIDNGYLKSLPESPILLISNLARAGNDGIKPVPLPILANRLSLLLGMDEVIGFEHTELEIKSAENDISERIPAELQDSDLPLRLINVNHLGKLSEAV